MRVAVASDHGGYPLKQVVLDAVTGAGHEALDLGTDSPERVDYPDFAQKAGKMLQSGAVERAILICGSGVGVCITANKMKGVYAALCHDTYSAHQGVEHDNMNTLCLGGRIIGPELAGELVKAFLSAQYLGTGQYQVRVSKMKKIEEEGD